MTEPAQLPSLPHLPLRTLEELALRARFIHEDRCSWMGDNTHPCTCGVPRTIRAAAAIWAEDPPVGEYPGDAPPLPPETTAPGTPA